MKNVLMLMSDQHKPNALSIDGDPLAVTPHLDKLARASVRFDNAYCTSPICVPSRASIFTGLYPHNHRAYGNTIPWPFEIQTIAHHFRRAGYVTANIGKLHAVDAQTHGFDYLLEMKDWFQYLGPKAEIWREEMNRNAADGRKGPVHVGRVSKLAEADHFESFVARESMRFLKTYGKRPFFLASSFIKPHDPFMPAERFAKRPVAFRPSELETPALQPREARTRAANLRVQLVDEARLPDSGFSDDQP